MYKKIISLLLTAAMALSLAACAKTPPAPEADPEPTPLPAPEKVLFIGNSAVYVNDIPGTLSRLAGQAGYTIQCESVVKGGATLHTASKSSTEHGQAVLQAIQGSDYDLIFIQDNANCISSESKQYISEAAFTELHELIAATGARTGIYFRAPYGHDKWYLTPYEQSEALDRHFSAVSESIGAVNVYVNRAFTIALDETVFNLYADDIEHTSPYGAYLAVCVFFATLFNTSSTVLDANGLPAEDARILQDIADRVALKGESPFH